MTDNSGQRTKILVVFGTRPEAIKMAPLVLELQKVRQFETRVCVTAQHREMLDQVLDFFKIIPNYDLNLMQPGQNLHTLTANIIIGMRDVLEDFLPDRVFVHGDTTTSTAVALASFYSGCSVVHVEAGLRTFNKKSPFPEEMNRSITGRIADIHFAPTALSKENLVKENVDPDSVVITGNTVIDALLLSVKKVGTLENNEIDELKFLLKNNTRDIILVTGHRRENFGDGFLNICKALKEISEKTSAVIIYPVHLNPNVQKPVFQILGNSPSIHLIKPLAYEAFIWLMNESKLIITDSGGVQEEAPSLGKPVLVMRDTTERPEAVEAGTVILVGTDPELIVSETIGLLNDKERYNAMSKLHNPYGDGKASERIVEYMKSNMEKNG